MSTQEHAEHVRAFDAELSRIRREGDTAARAAIDARHDAAGYADARERMRGVVCGSFGAPVAPSPAAESDDVPEWLFGRAVGMFGEVA